MATLSTVDVEDVTYLDFVEEGRRLARELKDEVRWVTDVTNVIIFRNVCVL